MSKPKTIAKLKIPANVMLRALQLAQKELATKAKPKSMLSKKAQKLIDEFSESSEVWGWERDQGTGKRVENAQASALQSRQALEKYVLSLEKRLKKIKNDIREGNP